jgi:hypothetical protein
VSVKWGLLFWAAVVLIVYLFAGKEGAMVAAAIAAISSVIMLFQGASGWEGTVIDTYSRKTTERIDNLEDDRPHTRTVIRDYANIKLRSGGVKEVEYKKGYWDIQKGDVIRKERGKTGWELIKKK